MSASRTSFEVCTPVLSPPFGLGFCSSLSSPKGDLDHSHVNCASSNLTGLGISYNHSTDSLFPEHMNMNIPSRHRRKLSLAKRDYDAEQQSVQFLNQQTYPTAPHPSDFSSPPESDVLRWRAVHSSPSVEVGDGSNVGNGLPERFTITPLRNRSPLLMHYQKTYALHCSMSPEIRHTSSEIFLPIVDINMRQLSMIRQSQSCGINPERLKFRSPRLSSPADSPLALHGYLLRHCSPVGEPSETNKISQNEMTVKTEPDIVDDDALLAPKELVHQAKKRPRYQDEASELEEQRHEATSSPDSTPRDRIVKRRICKELCLSSASSPIQLGRPLVNAHSGISLQDLRSRAEKFKLRNPGREYVKEWLLQFTGKLSSQGTPLKDYRCYVIGCQQTTKRRDHMLVHVGGHLDQRPFKCSHCPSRFLRKNERNRHELGHASLRPFVCHVCAFKPTFVRRDLWLRHIKRKHNDQEMTSKVGRGVKRELKSDEAGELVSTE